MPPKILIYVDGKPVSDVLPVWYRADVGPHDSTVSARAVGALLVRGIEHVNWWDCNCTPTSKSYFLDYISLAHRFTWRSFITSKAIIGALP